MKKILAVSVALIFLCSCTFFGDNSDTLTKNIEISFLLDQDTSDTYLSAINTFMESVSKKSAGTIRFKKISTNNVSLGLSKNKADMGFIPSKDIYQYSDYASFVCAPFTYRDYEHFAITANSPKVMDTVSKNMINQSGLRPLANYYNGSHHLMSHSSISGLSELNEFSETQSGVEIYLSDIYALPEYFEIFIWESSVIENIHSRQSSFLKSDNSMADFSLKDQEKISWPKDSFYFTTTYHYIDTNWLLIDDELYSSMSPLQKAAIEDSKNLLFPIIEKSIFLQEGLVLSELKEQGVIVSNLSQEMQRKISYSSVFDYIYSDFDSTGKKLQAFIKSIHTK